MEADHWTPNSHGEPERRRRCVRRSGQAVRADRVPCRLARHAGSGRSGGRGAEAFVKAYYALDRFRTDAPFRPWLLRIVANEARNRARSSRRRQGLALRAAAVSDGDAAPSPETAALAREDRDTLLAALNRLSPADREVIGHRYLIGLSESGNGGRAGRPGRDREVSPIASDGAPPGRPRRGGHGMSARLRAMSDDELGDASPPWTSTGRRRRISRHRSRRRRAAPRRAPSDSAPPVPQDPVDRRRDRGAARGCGRRREDRVRHRRRRREGDPGSRTNPSPTATIPFGQPIARGGRLDSSVPSSRCLQPSAHRIGSGRTSCSPRPTRSSGSRPHGSLVPACRRSRVRFGAVLMRFEETPTRRSGRLRVDRRPRDRHRERAERLLDDRAARDPTTHQRGASSTRAWRATSCCGGRRVHDASRDGPSESQGRPDRGDRRNPSTPAV